jgi:outer membrane protein assembly factor BamB
MEHTSGFRVASLWRKTYWGGVQQRLTRTMKTIFSFVSVAVFSVAQLSAANWPAFRNDGHGISSEKNAPLKWSATENVRWRTALPDKGNASPIVWGDKVFITQAVGPKRTVMCFDRASGKLLWQEGVSYAEKDDTHDTNPHASATPVTGDRAVRFGGRGGV